MNALRHSAFLIGWTLSAVQHCLAFADEPKTAAPAGNDRPQQLVFASRLDGIAQLVLVKDDGTEVKKLTNGKANNIFPAWSPDGKKIAFSSRDSFGPGLFILEIESGKLTHLTHGNDNCPAWSPDGKKIAYNHFTLPGTWQIMTIGLDDSADPKPAADDSGIGVIVHVVTPLTDGSHYDADPAWSPDGKQIAFASDRAGNGFRLYVMGANGKNVVDWSKTDNLGGNVFPSWSPDGRRIAYTEQVDDGTRQIFVIDRFGRNKKQLTKKGDFNCYAAWSPDGKKIAYMSFREKTSKGSLAIMNPDGSEQTILALEKGAGHNGRPAWKPK